MVVKSPTESPRGTGRAGMGVGQAHSTEEAGNDRGGKGPEFKVSARRGESDREIGQVPDNSGNG